MSTIMFPAKLTRVCGDAYPEEYVVKVEVTATVMDGALYDVTCRVAEDARLGDGTVILQQGWTHNPVDHEDRACIEEAYQRFIKPSVEYTPEWEQPGIVAFPDLFQPMPDYEAQSQERRAA